MQQPSGNTALTMKVYEYKTLQLEIKDADIKEGVVTGYGSSFDREDAAGDTVRPGAFAKTIAEQGPLSTQPRIKYLLNHDVSLPVGKLLTLEEDAFGLKYEAKSGSNNSAQDYLKMIESGLITEHSIGYRTIKQLVNQETYQADLLEIKLYEISGLSGWGCNQWTPLTGVKSEDQLAAATKRMERLEKFCRNSTATDETIEALLIEVKQLNQLVADLKSTEPVKSTQPAKKDWDWGYIATQLIKN